MKGAVAAGPIGRPLGLSEWLALGLVTAAAVAGLHAWFAPGFMSYDSLLFYDQALHGVTRSTWPPMYTYLIVLTRALGGDYGALFLAQDAMVFGFGGFLVLRLSGGSTVRRILALILFMAAFVAVPTLLGTTMVLWNVTPVAGFALAGASCQLLATQRRGLAWALAAVLAYAVCFALRYNSIFLIAPMLIVLLAWPTGAPGAWRDRAAVWAVTALAFAAAALSFSHRLPDLKALPANAGVRTFQTFDIVGVSARCGESFLTPEMLANGPVPLAALRAHYDPRHLNISLAARPGLPAIPKPRDSAAVNDAWRRAVTAHPGCYLAHRWASFQAQMGADPSGVFYAAHGGVDPNRYGFVLAHPERATAAAAAVTRAADNPLRRPAWLYLGALVAVLAVRRDTRLAPLALLTLGAFAYAFSHLLVAAAADARYIFPSNVACAAVIAAALGGRARTRSEGKGGAA